MATERISRWVMKTGILLEAVEECPDSSKASLTTIAAVVKQAEGDKYVNSSLVLSFIKTCMKSLAEDGVLSSRGLALGRKHAE